MKRFFITALLVLTLTFTMCLTAFASVPTFRAPNMPTGYNSYIICVDSYDTSTYRCMLFNSQDYDTYYLSGSARDYVEFRAKDTDFLPVLYYVTTNSYDPSGDNNGWGSSTWSSATSKFQADFSEILYLNVNILDDNNNVVFQPTFSQAETVLMSLEEALTNLSQKVGGTMMILLACGVGCLASLVALKVFGKVLPRFRS